MQVPRAENIIRPENLDSGIFKGWYAQVKMNGQYLVVTVAKDKTVSALDRHGKKPAWNFNPNTRALWARLPPGVYCAELLHAKVKEIRNTFYLHDIIEADGKTLLGVPYRDRYRLLIKYLEPFAVYNGRAAYVPYWQYGDSFWAAKNFTNISFKGLFDSLIRPEEEGLVLKNPDAKLTHNNQQGWTVKCRRPTKNFQF